MTFILEGEPLSCYSKGQVHIPLKDKTPVWTKPYPVPDKAKNLFAKELSDLENEGIIEKADSPYCSPGFLLVKEKDRKISTRLICDYRKLKEKIRDISHPIPLVSQVLGQLSNSKYFSVCDLSRAFNQLELDEESRDVLAFSTPAGQMR